MEDKKIRVHLFGPLEVRRRLSPDEVWMPVAKETWGKGRFARSVFKRLLAAPGRRLSRGRLQEDLWPETDFELADSYLYNAMTNIRAVVGKELVHSLESFYELADQSRLWVDCDVCESLLKEAENRGPGTVETLPLLEEALSYLERGAFLEGEDGTWCYGPRKKYEDMLRHCRLWLAGSYEAVGKLWQAGEQYRALCALIPPDEEALSAWLAMLHRHGKAQEAQKCYQDARGFFEEQGYTLSLVIEPESTGTFKPAPFFSLPPHDIMGELYQPGRQDMRIVQRRHVLQQILGVISSPLLPFDLTPQTTPPIEDYLSTCEENILACWRLMKGSEIAVVQSVLSTWLPPLEHIIRESAPHRSRGAALAVQGYIIAGLVTVLRRAYDSAEWCCKQALEYSDLAEDDNLKVASLKHLATKYHSAKYFMKTLHTYQEALESIERASPLLQSRIYLGLALSYAQCQEKQEAFRYLGLAHETFPERPEDDPSFPYADCGRSSLNHYGGLIYLEFGQPRKAWETFEDVAQMQHQVVIPERTIIEIINCKADAAIAQKNLELACSHLQEGVEGAIRLKSAKRFHDSSLVYKKARALWPHERSLVALEDLFQQEKGTLR